MKAAVCYEYGKPLVVEEIDIDPPQKGEVKVRIGATAICHSDIHVIRGELGGRLPLLAGHESAGYVEEVDERIRTRMLDLQRCRVFAILAPSFRGSPQRRASRKN